MTIIPPIQPIRKPPALCTALLACTLAACNGGNGDETTADRTIKSVPADSGLFITAKALEAEGRYPAAAEKYRQFLLQKPTGVQKTHAMIKTVVLAEAVKYGTGASFELFMQAINEREQGNWPVALQTLNTLINQNNNDYLSDDAQYLKAYIILTDQKHYRAAYELLGQLISDFPDSTYIDTALYSRGIAQKMLGNNTLAERHFLELQERHSGLTIDLFNLRWPLDNFESRLWFTRAHQQLVLLETDSRIGLPPSEQQMRDRDLDERANIVVVFTDDQGYADLGASGILSDIQTPHIDQLAADGVRMTSGYVTAPQCTPSRAGLLTGKYQQRFGLDDNRYTPMPLSELTIGDRLQDAGYTTGMVGKWHLEIDQNSIAYDQATLTPEQRLPYFPHVRGFDDVYFGYQNTWWTNFDLSGNTVPVNYRRNTDYRLDVATEAGLAFIERHKQQPFFLYMSYYAPHVPLAATEKYLSRHQNIAQERRHTALAMMSAIDDGVGRLRDNLEENGLTDNTLIFFISDNGAPLGLHKLDVDIEDNTGVWDGSLNNPWVGEKGMLSEGGIRVPYIVTWPGKLPSNTVYDSAVSTLDMATTSLAAARADIPADLDGSNLLAHLTGEEYGLEERSLYWRFWTQAAVRKGPWKYLAAGNREYLFNLDGNHETENLLQQRPDIASSLRDDLRGWTDSLQRKDYPSGNLSGQEAQWYNFYLTE